MINAHTVEIARATCHPTTEERRRVHALQVARVSASLRAMPDAPRVNRRTANPYGRI